MIRAATVADVAVVVELERDAFGPGAWSADTVRAELALPDRLVLVAERDAVVVGYVDVGVVADVADLHRVAVAATHRRGSVGTTLLDAGRAAAADRGAVRMLLEVADDNVPALALYARSGFEPIARRRAYYGPGRDALVLEAPLPTPPTEQSR